MAILKPTSMSPSIPVTATSPITISWKNLGDRQYYYQVQIYKNSDNSLVLNTTKISSLNAFYVVAANTLTNGTTYKFNVTVWNQSDVSAVSEWVIFKCSSTPVVSFTNLSSTIQNSNYTFTGEYSQLESIAIKSWQIILYNIYNEIIGDSGLIYNSTISHEFFGLINLNNYKIELQARSQDNLLATTGKQSFNVSFEVPKSAIALEAISVDEKASVQLQWNVSQIIGTSDSSTYIGAEKLDLTGGKKVYFDDGFSISNNFTTELWLSSVTDYTFNINTNTQLISYKNVIGDTNALWLVDSSQNTEIALNVVIGNQAPISPDYLWIYDINISGTTQFEQVICDVYHPTNINSLWLDLSNGADVDLEVFKMRNANGEFISIRYFNGAFNLYRNDELIDKVIVSGSNYYLYIQQIGSDLTLHAEVIS